ncbi:MAG: hypothetical protein JXD23_02105 [Spirochaetales bacterium]|nr:hypothetical protein [Spirochaetales bacterium]
MKLETVPFILLALLPLASCGAPAGEPAPHFIAVGMLGSVYLSPDGYSWSGNVGPGGLNLYGVAYGGGTIVAVGDSSTVHHSTDGRTWTQASSPPAGPVTLYGVAYGNSRFVAVSFGGGAFYSADGDVWTSAAAPPSGTGDTDTLRAVVYGDNEFVAVGDANTAHLSDSTGNVWGVDSNPGTTTTSALGGVAWSGSRYVVAGNFGVACWSTTGTTWSADTFTLTDHLMNVTYADGQFRAVSNGGYVFNSADGTSWSAGFGPGSPNEFYAIAYGSGRYVVVGSLNLDTAAYWSTDGTNWNPSQSVSGVPNLFAIAYIP